MEIKKHIQKRIKIFITILLGLLGVFLIKFLFTIDGREILEFAASASVLLIAGFVYLLLELLILKKEQKKKEV
ncbi:MAG: hypothetical protein R3214_03300 [Christiangramia sp.]|nr:hypothetical protein [Christiangramia sp.]